MSWIEKTKTDFIITCGDGKRFKPLWMNASKTKEYNISEFDFPNLSGTLVDRRTAKGTKFNIEIIFQGEDHLDQSSAFESSADDKRPWTIEHPFYGNIIVQPTSLSFDNTKLNVTKITGTVIETITEDAPKMSSDPIDKIKDDKENFDEILSESYDVVPDVADINEITTQTNRIYLEGVKLIKLDTDAAAYFNLFNIANALLLNATADPIAALEALNTMLAYPALLEESAKNRINTLSEQFNRFVRPDTEEETFERSQKKIIENHGAAIISSQCLAAATPIATDYANRDEVLLIVESIIEDYNNFIEDLDELQTDNGGDTDSYIPDANSLIALNKLVNYTISNLFNIALNAKQERSIFVEYDTNIILLAHRFYGLEIDDSTLNELIRNNNIGLNEHLQIRKGRRIIYYI
jgi:prophage DNA circulation protein